MLVPDLEPLSYEHEFSPTIPCIIREASRGLEMQKETMGSAEDDGLVFRYLIRADR